MFVSSAYLQRQRRSLRQESSGHPFQLPFLGLLAQIPPPHCRAAESSSPPVDFRSRGIVVARPIAEQNLVTALADAVLVARRLGFPRDERQN
jgi:hypothetical protein